MALDLRLRRGLKANLPASANDGAPLITTDSNELYVGTGTGVAKISDVIVAATAPSDHNTNKIWIDTTDNVVKRWNTGTSAWVSLSEHADLSPYFKHDGTVSATGAFNMNSHKITGVTNGTDPGDAVNFSQLDTKMDKAGGTFTGAVGFAGDIYLSNGTTFNADGVTLSSIGEPTASDDAATKGYVDAIAQGLDLKHSVKVATIGANIALDGTVTAIDGVTLADGDRVLVKDQTVETENGIYVVTDIVTPSAWARAADANNTPAAEVTSGMFTYVEEGTVNAGAGFVIVSPNSATYTIGGIPAIELGVDDILFSQFSGAGQLVAGNGISISANVISLASSVAGAGLTYTSGVLAVGVGHGLSVGADQIDLTLDGSTLSKSASGLKVAAAGITATEINSSALGNGLQGGSGTALSIKLKATDSGLVVDGDGLAVDLLDLGSF